MKQFFSGSKQNVKTSNQCKQRLSLHRLRLMAVKSISYENFPDRFLSYSGDERGAAHD